MPASREQTFLAQPLATGGRGLIVSPFQFVTTGEDRFRIVSANSQTGVAVTLFGRRLNEQGVLVPFGYRHVPTTDRTLQTQEFELGVGALLNVHVVASAGSPLIGQTFVIVQLIRGTGAAAIVLGLLLQGYVTSAQGLGWPGSPIVSSTSGEPYLRVFTGTDPAVGSQVLETVPTGARWELLSLRVGFTTSAASATRRVTLFARLSGAVLFQVLAFNVQLASLTNAYTFAPDLEGTSDLNANLIQSGTPSRVLLPAGTEIGTGVTAGDAGDDFIAPILAVREWLEVT